MLAVLPPGTRTASAAAIRSRGLSGMPNSRTAFTSAKPDSISYIRAMPQSSLPPAVGRNTTRGRSTPVSETANRRSPGLTPPMATIVPGTTRVSHRVSGKIPQMRYVYDLDEDSGGGRELLGGKGVGLAEMTQLGIPVPAGFTVTTDACRAYMAAGGTAPEGLDEEIAEHGEALEERAGKRFGDQSDPLLVSVRSGAAVSMPGMMDTILNLGLNDAAVECVARSTGNARFAFDSYRRLIQMYGEVVEGGDRRRVPAGRGRAASACVSRRLRVVELTACPGVPADVRHPGRPRHGGQRGADGLREPR